MLLVIGGTTTPPDRLSDGAPGELPDRPDERPPGGRADRHLEVKIWIFSIAAGVALVGIYFEERWMTGLALTLLLGSVVLRFVSRGDANGGGEAGDKAGEEAGEEAETGSADR